MKKIIYNIIFAIYAIIAVFTTICLLSYNEYKITELGDKALIIINDDDISPEYNKGDLVIVNKADRKKVKAGDKIFFYNIEGKNVNISLASVIDRNVLTSTETTYTIEGDDILSESSVIGPASTATKIAKIGAVLGVLESKWGFLFLIVLPSLIAFIYEVGVVFSEIRNAKKDRNKE